MSSGVFLLKKDGSLVEMSQSEYDSEDRLQTLLADYPNLLAGDQIDEVNPRKWILVSRELSVPDEETSDGRWSLDHLFLDQDGVPTLLEVKRSSDTRIRREVLGQMLEYAANATSYWNIGKIRSHYEANCEKNNIDPRQVWIDRLQLEEGYDEYWEKVGTNLRDGHVRLLFVSDEISLEFKRIVEFLNEQMTSAEVLALEIKQYVGESQKALIPRIYGQSPRIQARKTGSTRPGKQWDETSFLGELRVREGEEAVDIAQKVISWAHLKELTVWWGKGGQSGSCYPLIEHNKRTYWLFALWTYGAVEIQFQHIKNRPQYEDPDKRLRLLEKLNGIPGVSIPRDGIDRRPSIPIKALSSRGSLELFLGIWDEYVAEIRRTS